MILIVLEKIAIMFIVLALGFFSYRKNLLDDHMVKKLSTFLLQVISPLLLFVSYQMSYNEELLLNLGYAFLLSLGAFAIQIFLGHVLIPKRNRHHAVERLSVIYANCGFFGIPLIYGLFGSEGIFYLTAYLTVFYIFFWTHGVLLMIGRTTFKEAVRNLISPAIVAVFLGLFCFSFQLMLPHVIVSALDSVASMNTPLAMLVAGATLAQSNIKACFSSGRAYWISAIKLLIIPFGVVVFMSFFAVSPMLRMVIILATACPVAVICTMFAVRYGKDGVYASYLFIVSTLFVVVSIPIVVAFSGLLGIRF